MAINNKSNNTQNINDVLNGEEPTNEFLEEVYALHNSSVSDEEVERQAMELVLKIKPPIEPSYKTSESSWVGVIFMFALLVLAIISYQQWSA
jgi:hypothetical protein